MKKIVLLLSFIALSASCTDDITGLNENTKEATTTKPEYLFTNAQKSLVDQMTETSVNFNVFRLFSQQWAETTYPDESQYNITTRSIPDAHFRVMYKDVLRDLKEADLLLDAEVYTTVGTPEEIAAYVAEQNLIRDNKKAVIAILRAYTFNVLVDTFGDVPYEEALDIAKFPQPKYADGLTMYKDLIAKLTAATNTLDANSSLENFESHDLIYGGDEAQWEKFANSLRLKFAVNLADVDATYSNAEVASAVAAGIFESNADNANFQYLNEQPNANPLYVNLVASGRHDFVPANTLVTRMNELADPRRAKYFTQYTSGVYKGGKQGASNGYSGSSHVNPTLEDPTYRGTILEYSEIEFLLAEVAARGGDDATAATHYNAGIIASMENWGVAPAAIATYLADPKVAYATAGTDKITDPSTAVVIAKTGSGTWQEKIGYQSWIALYNRGFESWTSFRRLDYPALLAPAAAYNGLPTVPTRFSYPAREETLNSASVSAAITKMGGNTLTTKIFWDKF